MILVVFPCNDFRAGVPEQLLASPSGLWTPAFDGGDVVADGCWTVDTLVVDEVVTSAEGDITPGLGDDPDSADASPEPNELRIQMNNGA